MTTGEYLVANSTLSSGTALQHLLALQIGSGDGPGRTVFSAKMVSMLSEPGHRYLVSRPERIQINQQRNHLETRTRTEVLYVSANQESGSVVSTANKMAVTRLAQK